jgi:hypothetical protein
MHFSKYVQVSLRETDKDISLESCEIRFPLSGGGQRSGKLMVLVTVMIKS